ncbi:flagellar hook-length control protein FliK [Nocardioides pacificus]
MSSTALPVGPMPVASPVAAPSAGGRDASGSAQAGEEFLALVQQLLGGPAVPVDAGTGEPAAEETPAEAPAAADGADVDTAAPWAPVPPGLAQLIPASGPATAEAAAQLAAPAPDADGTTDAKTGGTAALADADLAAPTAGIPGGGSSRPGTGGQPQTPQPGATPGSLTSPTSTAADGAFDAAAPTGPSTGATTGTGAIPAGMTAANEAAPAPTGLGVNGPTATVATTAVDGTAPAAQARVTEQVFPEVVRIAGNGNGMQRLTLRLQPENLGEVRVVLISRPGEQLVVSLAAGAEAQESLLNGSSELRRLLETIGNGDARIVVRDLASGAPGVSQSTAGQQTSQQFGQQLSQQYGSDFLSDLGSGASGSGDGDPDGEPNTDQHAGTRGSSSAMDGTDGAATSPHRVDPVTGARTAGIDVTV